MFIHMYRLSKQPTVNKCVNLPLELDNICICCPTEIFAISKSCNKYIKESKILFLDNYKKLSFSIQWTFL